MTCRYSSTKILRQLNTVYPRFRAVFVGPQASQFGSMGKCVNRSEGFPRTRKTKSSCACDCGRGPVSVGAFFFLLSSFFFLLSSFFFLLSSFFFLLSSSFFFLLSSSLTQNRALKSRFLLEKAMSFGRGGPGEAQVRTNEKRKEKKRKEKKRKEKKRKEKKRKEKKKQRKKNETNSNMKK